MQDSVIYIVLALLCVVIYLLLIKRKIKKMIKANEELGRLKDIFN